MVEKGHLYERGAARLALTSLWLGSVGMMGWLILIGVIDWAIGDGATPGSQSLNNLGLAIFLGLAMNFAGAVMAVVSLVSGQVVTRRAIAGLALNGLELLAVLIVILAGLVSQGR